MSGPASGPASGTNRPASGTNRRTCVGCRQSGDPTGMLRFVAVEGVVVLDARHRLPGRGAWLHAQAGCADQAERRRAWSRALRVAGALDVSAVRTAVQATV